MRWWGAEKGERTEGRQGYRSGYYRRSLVTRVGKIELRVPQDRAGRFSTEVFGRYQRSEKALVSALTEMYLQGVSTRKVKAISEELCGQEFSASTISALNKKLDGELQRFARRRLESEYPYLILDARYEKVREPTRTSLVNRPLSGWGRPSFSIRATLHGVCGPRTAGKIQCLSSCLSTTKRSTSASFHSKSRKNMKNNFAG